MKELIISKGWSYDHTCGCTPKYDLWRNSDYPNFQIWINDNTFKIKKSPNNNMWNMISSGGRLQFENTYNTLFQ